MSTKDIAYRLIRNNVAVQSNYSCGTCIIPEQASETLPAFNAIARDTSLSRLGEQHEVSLPLVRALGMEVRKILVESAPQRTLTEQNEPGKTLFLYRAHPTFRERVQIGRARWKSQWFHSSVLQDRSESCTELRIAVMQNVALAPQGSAFGIS